MDYALNNWILQSSSICLVKFFYKCSILVTISKLNFPLVNIMKTVIISANTSRYLLNYRRNTILKFIENGFHVICISSKDDCTEALKDIGCQWLNLKINSKGNNPFTDMRVFFRLFYIYLKYQPKASFHFNIKYNNSFLNR